MLQIRILICYHHIGFLQGNKNGEIEKKQLNHIPVLFANIAQISPFYIKVPLLLGVKTNYAGGVQMEKQKKIRLISHSVRMNTGRQTIHSTKYTMNKKGIGD